jgi:ribosomal protein S18 acetylase RimI-like enzyme
MNLVHFKRFRMEVDLSDRVFSPPEPNEHHYRFFSWDDSLLDAFAKAKYLSFREEPDTDIFPCLGTFEGCRRLMEKIAKHSGFLPEATWLTLFADQTATPTHTATPKLVYCGTVQGVRDASGYGAIQNLGVMEEHRRQGVGAGLLLRALKGFQQAGIRRAYLEVSAHNTVAIRLYRRFGFSTVRVVYKPVESAVARE